MEPVLPFDPVWPQRHLLTAAGVGFFATAAGAMMTYG
jgi:hypothetical protein